jgi:hypothetical protein
MDMSAFIGRTVITVMDPSTAAQEVSTVTIYAVNPTGHDPGGDAQRH